MIRMRAKLSTEKSRAGRKMSLAKGEHDKEEVELGRPVRFRADLPIEHGAQHEQRGQADEELPAFQTTRFGAPQGADQRCRRGLDQRIKAAWNASLTRAAPRPGSV